MARRWPSRSGAGSPRRRSMSAWMRSRLSRICWIFLLSGPHCACCPLNRTRKLFFSQPARWAAASWRSISVCWLAAALLELAKLIGAAGIVVAAVEGLELGFESGAERILLRLRLRGLRRRLLLGMRGQQRREKHGGGRERAAPSQFHRIPHSPLGLQRAPFESDFEPRMVSKVWTPNRRFGQDSAVWAFSVLAATGERDRRDSANRFHNTPQMIRPAPANTKPSSASP